MSFFQSRYDCIIIGASLSGLTAAIELQSKGKNVLVLEQGANPGGLASGFTLGSFEFDASLHQLAGVGSEQDPSYLREYFDEIGIEVKWLKTREAFQFILPEYKFLVPFGVETLAETLDRETPGEMPKVIKLFKLCKQIHECINQIYQNMPNRNTIIKKYPEFVKYANDTLLEVLMSFELSEKTIEILSATWLFFGMPINELSFIPWAYMTSDVINNGTYIPKNGSYAIACQLEKKAKELGVQIEYHAKVKSIMVDGQVIRGLNLVNGESLRCDYLISGISPSKVYAKMIEPLGSVPEKALKLINAREVGASAFSIYLALDVTPDKLNIYTYNYIIGKTTDPNANYVNYHSTEPYEYMSVVCRNVIDHDVSPKGTTTLVITAFPDVREWEKIEMKNYIELKRTIAKTMIERVSEALDCDLLSHIVEISIATPITLSSQVGAWRGSILGYAQSTYDSILVRLNKYEEECLIKGLYFAGSNGPFGSGMSASILNGRMAAIGVFNEMNNQGRRK